jgi:multiple sugar transport system permease protein
VTTAATQTADRTTPARRDRTRRGAARLSGRERLFLLTAVLPAVAWLAFAQGYPLLYSLYLSVRNWSLADSASPQGFAGLGNFTAVLSDPQFVHGLQLSTIFLASVVVELVIGFVLAYYTIGESRRIRLTRTLLIIPMVIAPIAVGSIWRLLLDPNSGLVDMITSHLGLGRIDWLGGPHSAVLAIVGIDVWEWVPFSMIIYSAAISGIDQSLIESARVDGASAWQTVRSIIVPMVLPATLLICVFRLIDAFLVIDVVYSLTYGGPGFSTTTSTLWVYNHGLKYFDISQAAAASWILLVICVALAALVLALKSRVERWITGVA